MRLNQLGYLLTLFYQFQLVLLLLQMFISGAVIYAISSFKRWRCLSISRVRPKVAGYMFEHSISDAGEEQRCI